MARKRTLEEIGARAFCLQISVAAARWSEKTLTGMFTNPDGTPMEGKEVKERLGELRRAGYEVVPCGCPGSETMPGYCPGIEED